MPERLTKKDAKMLFAELYQICGGLGCNSKILDNLSAASRGLKPPHKTLLPLVDKESVPAETRVSNDFCDIDTIPDMGRTILFVADWTQYVGGDERYFLANLNKNDLDFYKKHKCMRPIDHESFHKCKRWKYLPDLSKNSC